MRWPLALRLAEGLEAAAVVTIKIDDDKNKAAVSFEKIMIFEFVVEEDKGKEEVFQNKGVSNNE